MSSQGLPADTYNLYVYSNKMEVVCNTNNNKTPQRPSRQIHRRRGWFRSLGLRANVTNKVDLFRQGLGRYHHRKEKGCDAGEGEPRAIMCWVQKLYEGERF
jgi:hypothetical protein